MKDADPRLSGSRRGRTLLQSLVVAETAVSVILLAGAGFLVRTLQNLEKVDLGFDAAHTMTMRIRRTATPIKLTRRRSASTTICSPQSALKTAWWQPARCCCVPWRGRSAGKRLTRPTINRPSTPGPIRLRISKSSHPGISGPSAAARSRPRFRGEDTAEHEPVATVSQSMAGTVRVLAAGRRGPCQPRSEAPRRPIAAHSGRGGGRCSLSRYSAGRFDIYLPYRQSGVPLSHLAVRPRAVGEPAIPVVRNACEGWTRPRRDFAFGDGRRVDRARPVRDSLCSCCRHCPGCAGIGRSRHLRNRFVQHRAAERIPIRLALGAGHGSLIRSAFGARMLQVLLGEFLGLGFVFSAFRMVSPFLYRVASADIEAFSRTAPYWLWLPRLRHGYRPAACYRRIRQRAGKHDDAAVGLTIRAIDSGAGQRVHDNGSRFRASLCVEFA